MQRGNRKTNEMPRFARLEIIKSTKKLIFKILELWHLNRSRIQRSRSNLTSQTSNYFLNHFDFLINKAVWVEEFLIVQEGSNRRP